MSSIFCCFGSRKKETIPAPAPTQITPAQVTSEKTEDHYVHIIKHAASDAMVAAPSAWRDMDQSLVRQELLRHQMSRQGSRTDLLTSVGGLPSRTPSPGQSPVLSAYKRASVGMRSDSDGGR